MTRLLATFTRKITSSRRENSPRSGVSLLHGPHEEAIDPVTHLGNILFKSGGRSFLCLLGSKFLTTATSIYLARALGKAELGIFSLIVGFVDVSMLLATQSLPLALVKYVADKREKENLGGLITTALLVMLTMTALLLFVVLSLSDWIANSLYHQPNMVPLFKVACLLIFVNTLHAISRALLQGFQNIFWLNLIHLATGLSLLPFTVVLVHFFSTGGALLAIGTSTLFVILPICIPLIVRELSQRHVPWQKLRPGLTHLSTLLRYSAPAFLSALTSTPQFWIISTWLARDAGFSTVGLFSVALALPRNLGILSSALSLPHIPLISEIHSTRPHILSILVPRTQSIFSFLLLLPALLLAALSKAIIPVLYGDSYSAAWTTMFLLSFYAYLAGVTNTIGHVLAGTGRMWSGFFLNSLQMSVLLLVSYWFIPRFSYLGAGFSYALASSFHTLTVYTFVRRRMHIELPGFWKITFLPGLLFILIFVPLTLPLSVNSATAMATTIALAGGLLAWKLLPSSPPAPGDPRGPSRETCS